MTDPIDPMDDPGLDRAVTALLRAKADRAANSAQPFELIQALVTTQATRIRRRLLTVGAFGVMVAVALVGLGLAGYLGPQLLVGVSPSPAPSAAGIAPLRRPLQIPALAAGGACPVTPVGLTLERLDSFQGAGPVRVNNLNDVPINELPVQNGWYGQKVFWAVDAREPGPVLVRVARIDGAGGIGLGADNGAELVLSNNYGGALVLGPTPSFPIERVFIDGVSFREPGCYFMQMDGPATTSTVVFRALIATVSAASADAVALANVSSTSPVFVTATTLTTYGAEAGGGSVVAAETAVWAVGLSGSFPAFSCGPYTATPHPCPSPATSALVLVDARTGAFIEGRMPAPGP